MKSNQSQEDFFEKKVLLTLEKYQMTNKSEHLLVGLSGGADSVSLLLCLKRLGFSVEAVHINHCLRGEESDRDENFCKNLCEKLEIRLTVSRIKVADYCEENSLSVEEGARKLRYEEFEKIGADKICTAHNLNDCLETTLFNLARGTGLKGICSIPPVRGKIIRPLIECSREEILAYLSNLGQDFVTDSTNLETEYSRNKLRHLVVPQLVEINGSLLKTYSSTLENLREDMNFLEKTAENAYESSKIGDCFDCENILKSDIAIRRRVIMLILENNGVEVSAQTVVRLENLIKEGGKLNVKKNLFACVENGRLRFVGDFSKTVEKIPAVKVEKLGEYKFGERAVTFKIWKNLKKIENVHKKFANCCLDYDKIKGEIVIRQRQSGDKIKLVNREVTSDVRKLVNKAFSVDERPQVVILADDEGVIFVENFGAADRVKIDSDSENIIYFEISHIK